MSSDIDNGHHYKIRPVAWDSEDAEYAKAIRFKVFVDEQKVPADLEIDDIDNSAFHIVAFDDDGIPCGTGRMFPAGDNPGCAKIGRMAVLEEARKNGCGRSMLSALVTEAKLQGYREAVLSAQSHAVPFYEKHGFKIVGDVFDDAGIPHYMMHRDL